METYVCGVTAVARITPGTTPSATTRGARSQTACGHTPSVRVGAQVAQANREGTGTVTEVEDGACVPRACCVIVVLSVCMACVCC